MTRTLVTVTLFVAVALSLFWVKHGVAQNSHRTFSGPDYGKDPPSKIVSLLVTLSG